MRNPLDNLPTCAIRPPARCYQEVGGSELAICGRIAKWKRPGSAFFEDEYFCDEHHNSGDVLITGAHAIRRVRLSVDVLLAGVNTAAPIAQTEAVARIEAAVRTIGGVLDIHGVRSSIVRYAAPPAQDEANWPRVVR
jgi:hypothetical protein